MSTLEEAYEHTEAYYDTERNRPFMATKSTFPKGLKPVLYADSAPSNIMKENERNAEKTVILYGKYSKEQLMVYVRLLGGSEDDFTTSTTIQRETSQESNKEKQLVEQASVSQQSEGN